MLAYLPFFFAESLRLASFKSVEPIVTSMPPAEFPRLDCRLVDRDGIYDSRIRGWLQVGRVFHGLAGPSAGVCRRL